MQNRTEVELKQIALDLFHGRIFTDRHIPEGHDLGMVFMVLMLSGEKIVESLKADPPGMVFEYLDKAMPRCINGIPCFFSMEMLSQDDTKKVFDYAKRLQQSQESAIHDEVHEHGQGI